jgi:3-methyladenine DNA glycosylase AlkD
MTSEILIQKLRDVFQTSGNETKATQMSKYMKGHFAYFGISAPLRNTIQKEWLKSIKGEEYDFWELIYTLWEQEEREFQMVAVDLFKKYPKRNINIEDINYLEHFIVTKSWWDTVDLIASNSVGFYFQKYPEKIEDIITKWRHSDNLWLNRTCLIFQLKYKDKVDFTLLKDLIIQYQPVKEFFIQKAIGWSLRQYTRVEPELVKEFVEEIQLSGLARREALRLL